MLDLKLVGSASPRKPAAIKAAFDAAAGRLPTAYVNLLAAWGQGELCAFLELPDPTARDGRHPQLARQLRERGPAARNRGLWLEVSERELVDAALLGLDRRGAALIARSSSDLVFLHTTGQTEAVGTFEKLVRDYLLGGGLDRSLQNDAGRIVYHWIEQELTVPAVYATQYLPSRNLLDALARGDQARVDAAIAQVQEQEVVPFTLIELVDRLIGAAGDAVDADMRASCVAELYTFAKRLMPALGEQIPLREVRRALAGTAPRDELRERLQRLARLPASSIFGDDAAPAPAADSAPPIANAADRGLIAPAGFPAPDADAAIAARVALWREQDPTADLEPLLEHIARLHPVQRQGYETLIAQLHKITRQHPSLHGVPPASRHLARELTDAWPQLVLALRSGPYTEAGDSLEILHEARFAPAIPYLRSLTLRPPPRIPDIWSAEAAYIEIAKPDGPAIKELALAILDPAARSTVRRKRIAYGWLEPFASDHDVFELYLSNFVAALPHSEAAIAKHPDDPRILPMLQKALQQEELRSTVGYEKNDPSYGDGYETVARLLARRGDPDGAAALAKVRRLARRSIL